jgi:deoxyribonuclease V
VKVRRLHKWHLSVRQAIRIQEIFSKKVVLEGECSNLRYVAGCDVACDVSQGALFGGVVLWDLKEGFIVEKRVFRMPVKFPYIPGLLGFRETPVLLNALSRLKGSPDVILVDGQGIAHPRGLGLASHLGLHVDVPTVGCAKKILVGEHNTLGPEKGDWTWLYFQGGPVGAVLRTRPGVRPVYVSPGHRVSVVGALQVVLRCLGGFRLPEPLRQAHLYVGHEKKSKLRYKGGAESELLPSW